MEAEIYAIPIPQGKGGKPKWIRTHALHASEGARADGVRVILYNLTRYSGARSRLGTPRGRPIRSPGIRSVQWQEKAIQRRRAQLLRMKQRAVLAALQRP